MRLHDHRPKRKRVDDMTSDVFGIWLSLARRFCAVSVTLSDCGCYTVSFFADGVKIIEEDKDLLTALSNAKEKAMCNDPAHSHN